MVVNVSHPHTPAAVTTTFELTITDYSFRVVVVTVCTTLQFPVLG